MTRKINNINYFIENILFLRKRKYDENIWIFFKLLSQSLLTGNFVFYLCEWAICLIYRWDVTDVTVMSTFLKR